MPGVSFREDQTMIVSFSDHLWWAILVAVSAVTCWIGLLLVGSEWARLRRWRRLLQSGLAPRASSFQQNPWLANLTRLVHHVGEIGLRWMSPLPTECNTLLTIAGYRQPNAVTYLLGAKLLAAVLTATMGPLIGLTGLLMASEREISADEVLRIVLLGCALVPVGWLVPDWWLRYRASRRQMRLQRSMPDFLDLLLVTIEAGLPLSAALDRIARVVGLTHQELGQELRQLVFDLRTSRSRAAALRAFAARTQVDAITSLTSVLIQTERFGVSLARTLRLHAESLRRKQQLHAEELAGTLPVKLLFPLIFFIFPAIFVVLLGPAVIQGLETLQSMLAP
jgi:tight adherence protein C